MGLPIWRDPEEKHCANKSAPKPDPTACLRSSIRRRPSIHGRGSTRARLRREPSSYYRYERDDPTGLREQRRGEQRGVPPISNLLEAANRPRGYRSGALPPPPAPETRNYAGLQFGSVSQDPFEADEDARLHYFAMDERGVRDWQDRRRRLRELQNRDPSRNIRLPHPHAELPNMLEEPRQSARLSPTPPAENHEPPAILLNPGEPLRILTSPEPIHTYSRPDSRNGSAARRSTLPTPPLDTSTPEESLFVPESDSAEPHRLRRAHPLSNSWRAESPLNGLGDRERSPESTDAWEIMRTTIAPDESLPSAESSFASAAASQSFSASNNSTQITDPDTSEDSENISSMDPDEMCTDEEVISTEAYAEDIYYNEMRTAEGRERIARHQAARDREGSRFALASEPASIDVGFRLIEEALETAEGRARVLSSGRDSAEGMRRLENVLDNHRHNPSARRQMRFVGAVDPYDHHGGNPPNYHDTFRRGRDARFPPLPPRTINTPPEYSPDGMSPPAPTTAVSNEENTTPTSPNPDTTNNTSRTEREVSEALLSGDVQPDLDTMRRVVERLAGRDDVPEEWWMSMGLNVSRDRPNHQRRTRATEREGSEGGRRVVYDDDWRSGVADEHGLTFDVERLRAFATLMDEGQEGGDGRSGSGRGESRL